MTAITTMKDAFPTMRIGYNDRLLGSNHTALPLLAEWQCRTGSKLPHAIHEAYPEIREAMQNMKPGNVKMQFSDLQIWFDVVPFPEAGYVGLYGYHIEAMVPNPSTTKLRMAA